MKMVLFFVSYGGLILFLIVAAVEKTEVTNLHLLAAIGVGVTAILYKPE